MVLMALLHPVVPLLRSRLENFRMTCLEQDIKYQYLIPETINRVRVVPGPAL